MPELEHFGGELNMSQGVNRPNTIRTSGIRIRGALLIAIGAVLTSGIGALIYWVGDAINNPASPNKFNGTPEQGRMIVVLLMALGAFGLFSIFIGAFQLFFGRSSKTLTWTLVGLFTLLAAAFWFLNVTF